MTDAPVIQEITRDLGVLYREQGQRPNIGVKDATTIPCNQQGF